MENQSVEKIINQLEKNQVNLSKKEILLKIYQTLDHTGGIQGSMDEVARILLFPQASSVRCVIHPVVFSSANITFSSQNGKNAEDYSYLDEQIGELLEKKSPLFVPDTSKIHTIKFKPDELFPKAIAAFEISRLKEPFGLIWLGFDAPIQITHDEFAFYNEISVAISSVLKKQIDLLEYGLLKRTAIQLAEMVDFPLLLTFDKKIFFSNPKAKSIFRSQELLDQSDGVPPQVAEETFIEIVDGKADQLTIGQKKYKTFLARREIDKTDVSAIALVDETGLKRRQELSALILESIAANLGPLVRNCLANLKMVSLIGDLNSNQMVYADNTREALTEIEQVIGDLMAMDRFTEERGLMVEPFTPTELIERVSFLLIQKTRQKRVEIQFSEQKTSQQILMDKSLLTQSLYFILDFAIERSRMGGIIQVQEKFVKGDWQATITDASKGMSQGEIEQLFSKADSTQKNNEISLAYRIIRYLGGDLSVKSDLDFGCQYILRLPSHT